MKRIFGIRLKWTFLKEKFSCICLVKRHCFTLVCFSFTFRLFYLDFSFFQSFECDSILLLFSSILKLRISILFLSFLDSISLVYFSVTLFPTFSTFLFPFCLIQSFLPLNLSQFCLLLFFHRLPPAGKNYQKYKVGEQRSRIFHFDKLTLPRNLISLRLFSIETMTFYHTKNQNIQQ